MKKRSSRSAFFLTGSSLTTDAELNGTLQRFATDKTLSSKYPLERALGNLGSSHLLGRSAESGPANRQAIIEAPVTLLNQIARLFCQLKPCSAFTFVASKTKKAYTQPLLQACFDILIQNPDRAEALTTALLTLDEKGMLVKCEPDDFALMAHSPSLETAVDTIALRENNLSTDSDNSLLQQPSKNSMEQETDYQKIAGTVICAIAIIGSIITGGVFSLALWGVVCLLIAAIALSIGWANSPECQLSDKTYYAGMVL